MKLKSYLCMPDTVLRFICFLWASASSRSVLRNSGAGSFALLASGWIMMSAGVLAVYRSGPLTFFMSCVAMVAAKRLSQIVSCKRV